MIDLSQVSLKELQEEVEKRKSAEIQACLLLLNEALERLEVIDVDLIAFNELYSITNFSYNEKENKLFYAEYIKREQE